MQDSSTRQQPVFMRSPLFIGGFVLLGVVFALQEWMGMRLWSYHVALALELKAWGVQYLLLGVICWIVWWGLGERIQRASLQRLLLLGLPLSIVAGVLEEMAWVFCFPNLPLHHEHMSYWPRLFFHLNAELLDNMVIFWCAIALFRGVGYYQQAREREAAAAQLQTQLARAQIHALRMQLNPHFLFNAMNSISSLMQTDIAAADMMLEQLSSLLRITLERGEVQLIPLSDEMEFVEMYLAMQNVRFTGRVKQKISVDPELHDALVPAMLLQPLIENAYSHGLSKLDKPGMLTVAVRRQDAALTISVTNSGLGLQSACTNGNSRQGVGIANVKDRLRLHYGGDHAFSIQELEQGEVQVRLTLPLQFSERQTETLTRYGA